LHLENTEVIAFSRSVPGNDVLVLVNLAKETQSQEIELGELAGVYLDWFSGESLTLSKVETMNLAGNSFRVLVRTHGVPG
jgi:hypothetical protein